MTDSVSFQPGHRITHAKFGPGVILDVAHDGYLRAFFGIGERRVLVQPIAINQDGTRAPAVERQSERYLQAPPGTPTLSAEQRLDLFARSVEPTLQRELMHKGTANGDGSYSTELIGYVEIY